MEIVGLGCVESLVVFPERLVAGSLIIQLVSQCFSMSVITRLNETAVNCHHVTESHGWATAL